MTTKKVSLTFLLCLLAGCGLFDKERLQIDGERIAVLQGATELAPDYAPGEIKVTLPRPENNTRWSQNGGNAPHAMGHLTAADKIEEFWSSGFGTGSSKRDFLIASPVIAHKVVFAIDADAVVSAFRLDNGKRIWKRRLKPLVKDDKGTAMKGAGIAVYDRKVFATTGFGGVFALDMVTGKKLWAYFADTPIRIAPTVDKGMLFVQTMGNKLIALDQKTGKEIWNYKSEAEMTTLVGGASPAYDAYMDVVIAAFSSGELRAFKASTGTPLWADYLVSKRRTNSLANITAVKASPIIDGERVFAIGHSNILAAYDLRTGARIWEKEIGSANQPWVAGKYLFVLSDKFDLICLEKDSGKIVWNTNIPTGSDPEDRLGVFASGPVLASNRLLVTTSNGYVFSVSPYTGKILSYISLSDGVEMSPILADGVIVFTTNDADLVAYK